MSKNPDRDWKLAFKISLAFFVILFSLWLLRELASIIALFLVAFLVVYFISPVMKIFIRKKVPPFLSAILTFIILLAFLGLIFYAIIPGMINELSELATYLSTELIPMLEAGLMESALQELEALDYRFNLRITETITDFATGLVEGLPQYIEELLTGLGAISVAFFTGLWSLVVLVFIIFYLLIEVDKVKEKFTQLFPNIYHQNVVHVFSVVDEKVGAFVRGTIMRCLVVGFITGIILSITGMPFALMLGVIAGILNIVVYIGPVLAAIPAVLFSLVPNTPHPLLIIGVYLAAQSIDAFVLTPNLLGKAVDLSPLTIITTVLIGAHLAGLLGILLAIPLAAILKVIINHYYINSHSTNQRKPG